MTLELDKNELLFSYGTLQDEAVQVKTFGRRLKGHADSLVGYRLTLVEIGDKEFAAENGAQQRNAHFTGDASDVIDGAVFEITRYELEAADAYEPTDYKCKLVQLKSGVNAWLYVKC
jgi:gamma-glutamylcyclotransferase (GGCT)/AIG2-like uncharacterized protein YtfP